MIAALLLAAAAFAAPTPPTPRVVVAYVAGDAWTADGAAVGAVAPTAAFPELPRALDVTASDESPSVAVARLRAAYSTDVSVVVLSRPRPGRFGGVAVYPGVGVLRGSTRVDGLVTVADVVAHVSGERLLDLAPGDTEDVADLVLREERKRPYHGFFHAGLIALPMLLYIWLLFGRRPAGPRARRVARVLAAFPAGGFLAAAVPWWQCGWFGATLVVVAATFLVLGLGLLVARLTRAPAEVGIAAASALVLVVDLLAGGALQQRSMASYSLLAAGRFYGLGNVGFAVLATSGVVVCAAAARRFGPLCWLALVPVLALVAAPSYGADFGGAVTLTAVLVAALATRARRTAVVAGSLAGLAVALAVAWADYRSADPTHLGQFVDDVLHGGWTETVSRKGRAALSSLATWYPLLVAGTVALALRLRPRVAVVPFAVLFVVGSAVNDSGVAVAAVGMAVAGPLLVADR